MCVFRHIHGPIANKGLMYGGIQAIRPYLRFVSIALVPQGVRSPSVPFIYLINAAGYKKKPSLFVSPDCHQITTSDLSFSISQRALKNFPVPKLAIEIIL